MLVKMRIAAMVLALSCATAASTKNATEVWVNHVGIDALADKGAKWDFCKRNLDCMEFPINAIAFIIPEEKLKALVPVLRQNHIKIAVECGYFDWQSHQADFIAPNPKGISDTAREKFDDTVGEITALTEIKKIELLLRAGGVPDYLNLDGPIRRLLRPGSDVGRCNIKGLDSIDRAASELVDYMRIWRARFPKIQFFALTNFPNWGWKGEMSYWGGGMFYGDYFEALKGIIAKTKAAGIPILGVTADNPYEFFTGTYPHTAWIKMTDQAKATSGPSDPTKIDWAKRVLDLERYVESQGLEFNLIVNSCVGGDKSGEAFAKGTLDYLDAYRRAGGHPKRYIIQTWYKYPEKVYPEDEPNTMTNVLMRAIKKVKAMP